MKKYIALASAALGFTVFGLLASSCGLQSADTHQMGPPGKQHSMSDDQMPSKAR